MLQIQVEADGSNETQMWVLTKGAPEVVREFLEETPEGYDGAYKQYAAQGGR